MLHAFEPCFRVTWFANSKVCKVLTKIIKLVTVSKEKFCCRDPIKKYFARLSEWANMWSSPLITLVEYLNQIMLLQRVDSLLRSPHCSTDTRHMSYYSIYFGDNLFQFQYIYSLWQHLNMGTHSSSQKWHLKA